MFDIKSDVVKTLIELGVSEKDLFINDKTKFLSQLAKITEPNGLILIDWLHGMSNRPVLDFDGGGPVYAGQERIFKTTYIDEVFLKTRSRDFSRLSFSHV